MSLVNEIVAVEDYIKSVFPASTTVKQNVPTSPTADSFVIAFQRNNSETETNYHFRNDREFQLVYFGTDVVDTLSKMDQLNTQLNNDMVLPLNDGSLRYIRLGSFSMSQPFKTENDINAMIGVLTAEMREARTQEQYQKIMSVNMTIK